MSLNSPEGCRRFPLAPSEGVRGPFRGSGVLSALKGRAILSLAYAGCLLTGVVWAQSPVTVTLGPPANDGMLEHRRGYVEPEYDEPQYVEPRHVEPRYVEAAPEAVDPVDVVEPTFVGDELADLPELPEIEGLVVPSSPEGLTDGLRDYVAEAREAEQSREVPDEGVESAAEVADATDEESDDEPAPDRGALLRMFSSLRDT